MHLDEFDKKILERLQRDSTIAVADLVGSAMLVAVIVPRPPADGAVNTPVVLIVPMEAVQVTPSLVVAPCIAAVN